MICCAFLAGGTMCSSPLPHHLIGPVETEAVALGEQVLGNLTITPLMKERLQGRV
jgi:hypothetical protein